MGTFGTNRIYSVGRMVKVADRMRWGFVPAWVRFPPYLKCKIHQVVLQASTQWPAEELFQDDSTTAHPRWASFQQIVDYNSNCEWVVFQSCTTVFWVYSSVSHTSDVQTQQWWPCTGFGFVLESVDMLEWERNSFVLRNFNPWSLFHSRSRCWRTARQCRRDLNWFLSDPLLNYSYTILQCLWLSDFAINTLNCVTNLIVRC